MASLRVLAFDHEGRPVQFDTWLDDLQLYLLSDSRGGSRRGKPGLQLRERFRQDLPVLRLHSDRGAQHWLSHGGRSYLHDPCGCSPFSVAVCSPGSRAFVRNTSADKLSPRAIPCIFLGFPLDALGWQFYHPTSRRVFPSQDVTFDESVPFYRLFPYRSAPPPPLFLAPGPPPVDPLPPQGPAPSCVSQVDPLPGTVPVEVAGDSGAARGNASEGAASGGAEPGGAESESAGSRGAEPRGAELGGAEPGGAEPTGVELRGVEPVGVEPGGAESEGAESGGAVPRGAASSGGPAGASQRLSPRPEPLSPQQLPTGDTGAGGAEVTAGGIGGTAAADSGGARTRGTGAVGTGGVGGAGARDPTEPGAAWDGSTGAGGTGAGGAGVGGAGAGGTGAGDIGAGRAGARGTGAGGTGAGGSGAGGAGAVDPGVGGAGGTGAGGTSQPPLQPASPLHAPSPYTEQSGDLTERREPASCPVLPVRTTRRVPRLRPPPVLGTHAMALRPSSVPLRVPLLRPPESSLPIVPDPESDLARIASPTVSRLLATVVIDPSFDSTAASVLVAELLDFAAACRLDYANTLVAESVSASPPSVRGEFAFGTDVLEDRQEDFECLAAAVPRFASMLLAPEGDPDAPDIPTPHSYVEAITGEMSGASGSPSGVSSMATR
ncbi:unnamed protein product [Closterium sp. NIES-53]